MKRILTFVLLAGLVACQAEPMATAQPFPTAKEWNRDVVGWNLGNQLECSTPGQDGETLQIGNPEGALNAETAWGNPVVTRRTIQAVKKAGFNAVRIPVRWQCHITNAQAMTVDKASPAPTRTRPWKTTSSSTSTKAGARRRPK